MQGFMLHFLSLSLSSWAKTNEVHSEMKSGKSSFVSQEFRLEFLKSFVYCGGEMCSTLIFFFSLSLLNSTQISFSSFLFFSLHSSWLLFIPLWVTLRYFNNVFRLLGFDIFHSFCICLISTKGASFKSLIWYCFPHFTNTRSELRKERELGAVT